MWTSEIANATERNATVTSDRTATDGRERRPTIARAAKWFATVAVLLPVAGFALMLGLGLNANVMLTGSMEPKHPVGSLVLYETVAPDALAPGDVISFAKPLGDHAVVTHRIVAVHKRDGRPVFRTKGDNNAVHDPWLIWYEWGQRAQRSVVAIPHVGRLLLLSQLPIARMALIVVVLGFLFLTFLRALAASGMRDEGRPGLLATEQD